MSDETKEMSGQPRSLNGLVVCEPFFKQIDCESGWIDAIGFARCEAGSGCSDGLVSYCVKKDCPLIDEEEADNAPSEPEGATTK